MSFRNLHFLDIVVVTLALLLCAIAFFVHAYRSELLALGSLILFYFFLQVAVDRFSKNPAAGSTCVALTELDPEGQIVFAERPVDARAAKGFTIKSGQTCVIIDFKRALFNKGIYVVRPIEEDSES